MIQQHEHSLSSFAPEGAVYTFAQENAFKDALNTAVVEGIAFIDVPREIVAEYPGCARKLSDADNRYELEVLRYPAPYLSATWLSQIKAYLHGARITVGHIELGTNEVGGEARLHTDGAVGQGFALVMPMEGPEAELYHADSVAVYPGPSLPRTAYGVGRAALIRQRLDVVTSSGQEASLLAKWHGGWCTAGDRDLLLIDVHTVEPVQVSIV